MLARSAPCSGSTRPTTVPARSPAVPAERHASRTGCCAGFGTTPRSGRTAWSPASRPRGSSHLRRGRPRSRPARPDCAGLAGTPLRRRSGRRRHARGRCRGGAEDGRGSGRAVPRPGGIAGPNSPRAGRHPGRLATPRSPGAKRRRSSGRLDPPGGHPGNRSSTPESSRRPRRRPRGGVSGSHRQDPGRHHSSCSTHRLRVAGATRQAAAVRVPPGCPRAPYRRTRASRAGPHRPRRSHARERAHRRGGVLPVPSCDPGGLAAVVLPVASASGCRRSRRPARTR